MREQWGDVQFLTGLEARVRGQPTRRSIFCKIWYLISRTVSEDDASRQQQRGSFFLRFWDRGGSVSALFWGIGEGRAVWSTQRENLLSFAYCGVHVKNIGCRRSVMHAVIRSYSGKGTKALFDLLEKNKGEVESLIRGVKGFVSYSLVRTTRGGFSVSVYQDKAGADESSRAAREWIAKNASKTGVARPTISEGTVMLQLK